MPRKWAEEEEEEENVSEENKQAGRGKVGEEEEVTIEGHQQRHG